jgi:hypothetical protein
MLSRAFGTMAPIQYSQCQLKHGLQFFIRCENGESLTLPQPGHIAPGAPLEALIRRIPLAATSQVLDAAHSRGSALVKPAQPAPDRHGRVPSAKLETMHRKYLVSTWS